MSKIVLRSACSSDVSAILEFWGKAAEDAHRPPDSSSAVEALIRRDPEALILAVDEDSAPSQMLVGT
ncbi:hypothetical protein, partial [Nocardia sp. NPDC004722]